MTIQIIQALSRRDAEATVWPRNTGIISISTPNAQGLANLAAIRGGVAVCDLTFDDLDPAACLRNDGPDWRTLYEKSWGRPPMPCTKVHAQAAAGFLLRLTANPAVKGLIVHCEAGISRSVGMALAIAEALSLPFDIRPRQHPNAHVRSLTRDALCAQGFGGGR